jgi:TetR/AcrR family transcriptional regulator, regulator of autoinduction and epiphytic fitness
MSSNLPVPGRAAQRRRRSETRVEIIDAAQRLFRELSYDAVSMEAVAEAACVTRRTVYNHFVGRADLFAAVRERELMALGAMTQIPVTAGRSVHDTLVDFATATINVLSDPGFVHFTKSVICDGAQHRWLVEAYFRSVRLPILQALEIYLLRLMSVGEVDIADVHLTAHHFIGTLEALISMPRLLHAGETSVWSNESIARHAVDTLMLGVPATHASQRAAA